PRAARPNVPAPRLGVARALLDDHPLPRGPRGGARAPFRRDAVAQRGVRADLQQTLRPPRTPLRRALRIAVYRVRGIPRPGMRLRPAESGPRRPLRASHRLAVERHAVGLPRRVNPLGERVSAAPSEHLFDRTCPDTLGQLWPLKSSSF